MATQRTIPPLVKGSRIPMSYEEYLAIVPENIQAEWVNGEVIVFMAPSPRHQLIIGFLYSLLNSFVDLLNLGQVIVAPVEMRARLDGPAREPDILFVAREHLGRLTAQRLAGPADLVVEVISPESVRRDRVEKFREYAADGVPEYWLADSRPSQASLNGYRLTDTGEYEPITPDAAGCLHSAVLPGFWLDPAWLRRDPLPGPLALLRQIAPDALRAALVEGDAQPDSTT